MVMVGATSSAPQAQSCVRSSGRENAERLHFCRPRWHNSEVARVSLALQFFGRDYVAIRTAGQCSTSASVVIVDNAIATPHAARQSGVSSAARLIAVTSKASQASKLIAAARSAIAPVQSGPP